jgi:hypothetical protein
VPGGGLDPLTPNSMRRGDIGWRTIPAGAGAWASFPIDQRHAAMLPWAALSADDLQGAGATLRQLERFWLRGSDLLMTRRV